MAVWVENSVTFFFFFNFQPLIMKLCVLANRQCFHWGPFKHQNAWWVRMSESLEMNHDAFHNNGQYNSTTTSKCSVLWVWGNSVNFCISSCAAQHISSYRLKPLDFQNKVKNSPQKWRRSGYVLIFVLMDYIYLTLSWYDLKLQALYNMSQQSPTHNHWTLTQH